jgi:hypothetical protein
MMAAEGMRNLSDSPPGGNRIRTISGGPDPGPIGDLFYGCGPSINWDHYCSKDVDRSSSNRWKRPGATQADPLADLLTDAAETPGEDVPWIV